MKPCDKQSCNIRVHLITAAALVVSMAFAPGSALAADKDAHEDRAQLRVSDMHAKLKITATQEVQWEKVAQVMRDDAKTMDALTQTRTSHSKEMTALDDLKSYAEITEAHATGIKKLTAVFEPLYTSMSAPQKKEADALFRHDEHEHHEHQAAGK